MRLFFQLLLLVAFCTQSCSEDSEPSIPPVPGDDSLQIIEAFPQLDFNRPVDLQNSGNDYMYVVEQRGTIRVFENQPSVTNTESFLNIQDMVDDRDNEEGLLGLAFHPDFSGNGQFYVNYTTFQGTTRVSRFRVQSHNPPLADASSELVLLEFAQPFGNHNGGQLAFGPDGYLYVAVGDGGSGGDPQGHGQNPNTLLGSILRLDVDNPTGNLNYGIPGNNPYFNNNEGAREEIFAIGLRNPWRMSFDSETGQLWVADVGQNEFEEIDLIENGGNYGWKVKEAFDCFQGNNCDPSGLIDPYFHYEHDNGNISITGGLVYHGTISSLKGWYIYADYNSGRIWALQAGSSNPANQLLFDTSHRITTFGLDHLQELYFCSIDGKIFKFSVG